MKEVLILLLLSRIISCGSCHRPTLLLAGEPLCVFCEILDGRIIRCGN